MSEASCRPLIPLHLRVHHQDRKILAVRCFVNRVLHGYAWAENGSAKIWIPLICVKLPEHPAVFRPRRVLITTPDFSPLNAVSVSKNAADYDR